MAGSVIQATGTVELEDGLWIGNNLNAQNGIVDELRIIHEYVGKIQFNFMFRLADSSQWEEMRLLRKQNIIQFFLFRDNISRSDDSVNKALS